MHGRGGDLACRCPCSGPGLAARIARRQQLTSALFPGLGRPAGADTPELLAPVVTGTILDVSPHVLVIGRADGEHRLTLGPDVPAWRGEFAEVTTLRPGEPVVARLVPGRRDVAGKLWASIGRVAGMIAEREDDRLRVDGGPFRRRQDVVISSRAVNRIKVRFPRLEPGNVIDVIGLRRGGVLEALVPATAQPSHLAHRVSRVPAARPVGRTIRGTATWHEPVHGDYSATGAAYPAIDPAAECTECTVTGPEANVLPYLAIGSPLHVRNECTGAARVLPVTSCGTVARLFNDRCLDCGTSPRGRVADLTLASFAELGGDLERGCFSAAVTAGWQR